MKPRALDLFCGAGGASRGLQMAGFDVTGIDIKAQPRYGGDRFIQGDALAPPVRLDDFDFIWASPPCQAHTSMRSMHNARAHLDLIPATRDMLAAWGGLYVIENVVGAPLNDPVLLCGTMFGLGVGDAALRRHRIFEHNLGMVLTPRCSHGRGGVVGVYGGHVRDRRRTIGIYGEGCRDSVRKYDKGRDEFTVADGRAAMGIDWMTLAELCQSIPPAYSEYLGRIARRLVGT